MRRHHIRRIAKILARRGEHHDDDHAGDALAYVQAASVRATFSALLLRVFAIDVLECPRCQGRMRVLAFITEPDAVERIVQLLDLPTAPPCSSRDPPARRRASA